jgi:hypothetical protein
MLAALVEPPYSIDLSRRRSIWKILRSTLDLYRRYPLLFVSLAVGLIAAYELAVLLIAGYGPLAQHTHRSLQARIVLELLSFSLIGPLISALHVHAVISIGEGRMPRLIDVARRGLRVLLVVAAAAEIVANVGIVAGTYALAIPGIILSVRWSVVAQAAAVEHEGWLPALRRSWRLTSGSFWHIFGLILVTGLLALGIILGARTIPVGNSSGIISVTLGIAIDTVIASFLALTLAILYFDLLARELNPAPRRASEHRHLRDLD